VYYRNNLFGEIMLGGCFGLVFWIVFALIVLGVVASCS